MFFGPLTKVMHVLQKLKNGVGQPCRSGFSRDAPQGAQGKGGASRPRRATFAGYRPHRG